MDRGHLYPFRHTGICGLRGTMCFLFLIALQFGDQCCIPKNTAEGSVNEALNNLKSLSNELHRNSRVKTSEGMIILMVFAAIGALTICGCCIFCIRRFVLRSSSKPVSYQVVVVQQQIPLTNHSKDLYPSPDQVIPCPGNLD